MRGFNLNSVVKRIGDNGCPVSTERRAKLNKHQRNNLLREKADARLQPEQRGASGSVTTRAMDRPDDVQGVSQHQRDNNQKKS